MTKSVMGMFRYQEDSLDAAKNLKSSGFANPQMMSPVPVHDAYEVLEYGVSSVRRFSLMGAIVGAMAIGMMATPVIVGRVFDTTGTYRTSFLVLAAMCIVAAITITLATKPDIPSRSRQRPADGPCRLGHR